jgi:hypothetical protein
MRKEVYTLELSCMTNLDKAKFNDIFGKTFRQDTSYLSQIGTEEKKRLEKRAIS